MNDLYVSLGFGPAAQGVYVFDGIRRDDLTTREAVIQALNQELQSRDIVFSYSAALSLGLNGHHYKKGRTINT